MKRILVVLAALFMITCCGCSKKNNEINANVDITVETIQSSDDQAVSEKEGDESGRGDDPDDSADPDDSSDAGELRNIPAHFATVEEGQQLMRNRTLFHEQISKETLPFFIQRKKGTLDDYIEYSVEQVMEFTAEDEKRVNDTFIWFQDLLDKNGLRLPDIGTVTFVKTTGQEALGSAGYTSEGTVIAGQEALGSAGYTSEGTVFLGWFTFTSDYYTDDMFRELFVHELFHCFSRLNPDFRQEMYSIIHFSILDHDIDIPAEISSQIIANPDVEHHNSYATFTIDGEKKDCYLVFLTDTVFRRPGDTFFDGMYSGIVPLDGSKVYRVEEVEDFWDVVGHNTDYAEDPEEVMATDFSYALTRLETGYDEFDNPEILEKIIDCIRK